MKKAANDNLDRIDSPENFGKRLKYLRQHLEEPVLQKKGMEIAVLKCTGYEDLWNYLKKIEALGDIVGSIVNNGSVADETGEYFGLVIKDYAVIVANILESMDDLNKIMMFGDASLLSQLKKMKKNIEEGFLGDHQNLHESHEALMEIDDFLNNDLKQIKALKEDFKKINQEIGFKLNLITKKEASAKGESKAGAPAA